MYSKSLVLCNHLWKIHTDLWHTWHHDTWSWCVLFQLRGKTRSKRCEMNQRWDAKIILWWDNSENNQHLATFSTPGNIFIQLFLSSYSKCHIESCNSPTIIFKLHVLHEDRSHDESLCSSETWAGVNYGGFTHNMRLWIAHNYVQLWIIPPNTPPSGYNAFVKWDITSCNQGGENSLEASWSSCSSLDAFFLFYLTKGKASKICG